MKKIVLLLAFVLIACNTNTQQATIDQEKLNKYYSFVSFLVQENLSEEDKKLLYREVEEGMKVAPEQTMQTLNSMLAFADTVNKYINNPIALGNLRSYILYLYYPALQEQSKQAGKKYALQILIEKYSPILVVDNTGQRVYTEKDHKGFIEFLRFGVETIAGKKFKLPPQKEQEIKQKIVGFFPQMDNDGKNIFSAMAIYGPSMKQQYAQMNETEKQQFKQNFMTTFNINTQASAGGAMSPMEFQMMSNILRMQHETNMSIIQNIGSSNWRYEYDY